jgi:hypothetical protein
VRRVWLIKIQETTVSKDGIATGKPERLRNELSGEAGVFHREKRNRTGDKAVMRFVEVGFAIRHISSIIRCELRIV